MKTFQKAGSACLITGFVLCLALIFQSCLSVAVFQDIPRLEASVRAMDAAIDEKKFDEGLTMWSKARLKSELPEDYLIEYADRLLGLVDEELARTSVTSEAATTSDEEKKDFAVEIRMIDLLENRAVLQAHVGKQMDVEDKRPQYIVRLLEAYLANGHEQLALLTALETPEVLEDFPDISEKLISIAERHGNRWALDELAKAGIIDSSRTEGVRVLAPSEILKAVATVWVDKGIRMDRGVGLPDRVIGTAFFVETNGYLLTNYHVIASEVDPEYEGYSRLFVRLSARPQERVPARVIGWDPVLDLALLKTEVDAPATIPLSKLQGGLPGQRILVYGSPGGLENTLTAGIVSALGRRFLPLGDIMQIDAAVNPGNSGGPILNEEGEFLGIIFAGIPQFEGINFSVPASWIASSLPSLYKGGQADHAWLGMQVLEYENGLRTAYIVPGSPAYQLGLQSGDHLVALNGKKVSTVVDVHKILAAKSPGDIVHLEWIPSDGVILGAHGNDTEHKSTLLPLGIRPDSPLKDLAAAGYSPQTVLPFFGIKVEDISPAGLTPSLRVLEVMPSSSADEIGFSPGDTLQVLAWVYDPETRVVYFQFNAQRRKQGFLSQTLQLGAYVDLNDLM